MYMDERSETTRYVNSSVDLPAGAVMQKLGYVNSLLKELYHLANLKHGYYHKYPKTDDGIITPCQSQLRTPNP